MSIVRKYINLHELEEEILYHSYESKYHMEQYLLACEEARNHLAKFKEHIMYHVEFTGEFEGLVENA